MYNVHPARINIRPTSYPAIVFFRVLLDHIKLFVRTQVKTRTEKPYLVIGSGQPDFFKVCFDLNATYARTHKI